MRKENLLTKELKLLEEEKQKEEELLAQKEKLTLSLSEKLEKMEFSSLFTEADFSKKLEEGKKIEEKVNEIFLSLDLENRVALARIIMEDIIKSNANVNSDIQKDVNLTNFQNQEYKVNNQLIMLEKLLDYAGVKYEKKN